MAFGLKNTTALAERRRAQRESVNIAVVARTLAGERIPLVIEVLSTGGFLASTPQAIPKGTALDISFPTARTVRAQVVWVEDGKIGCRFATPVALADLLKSAEGQARPERRAFTGAHREPPAPAVEPRSFVPSEPEPAPPAKAEETSPADEAAWLDQFGWLPIETFTAIAHSDAGYLRPVLLRRGAQWAFGCLASQGWVDMTETGLGKVIGFAPSLWSPVSDDLAAELADL
jgi:hypothetical protein